MTNRKKEKKYTLESFKRRVNLTIGYTSALGLMCLLALLRGGRLW